MNKIMVKTHFVPSEYEIPVFFIDGIPLYEYFQKWNVTDIAPSLDPVDLFDIAWINHYDFVADARFMKYILEQEKAITPILSCPDDFDFSCTVIVVEVTKTEGHVHWGRIGVVDHADEPLEQDCVNQDVEDWNEELYRIRLEYTYPFYQDENNIIWLADCNFTFDRKEYDALVERCFKDMRLLFHMDRKDYDHCTHYFTRNSARAIIMKEDKVAMIHSLKYDYYKFPGGGIEKGEDPIEALIRETREEAGLVIIKQSIKEYGYVHIIHKSNFDEMECFVQDNFYYLCEVEEQMVSQELDDYEKDEKFALEFVDPKTAIAKNRQVLQTPFDPTMFEREAGVLELLIMENRFKP